MDPGIQARPNGSAGGAVPQPTHSQTEAAYQHYRMQHYHGDVQNLGQVDRSVSRQDRSKYGPLFGPLLHLINGRGEVDDKLSSTAKNLRHGLDIRSAPPAVRPHYEGISHQALYDSVTQNVDPASVGEVSDTWLQIGNKLANLQNTVAQSIASSQVTWSGKAAEKARQSIAKLGNQSGSAGQSAQLAGVLTAQQSEALSTAKNSIPPPPRPPFSAKAAAQQLQTIQDPIAFATQAAADQARAATRRAAHQMAAHVVQHYDQTVAQTSASMPAFAPAPPVVKGGKHALPSTPSGAGPVGGPTDGEPSPVRAGDVPSRIDRVGSVDRVPGGRHALVETVAPPPGPTGDQQTSTASVTPPGSGGLTVDGLDGPGNGPGALGVGPGTGGLNQGGGSGTGGPNIGGFGAGGLGAGGSGRAGGWSGAGSSAGDGAQGGRSGIGSAATAEEAAALREGVPGARGTGGFGGMGAGRGKGQGDSEHKRPAWLVENDEGLFGTDEMTAPPVIGE